MTWSIQTVSETKEKGLDPPDSSCGGSTEVLKGSNIHLKHLMKKWTDLTTPTNCGHSCEWVEKYTKNLVHLCVRL